MSSDDLLNADEVLEIVTNSRRSTTGGGLELDYKVLDFEIKRFGDDVLGFLGEYFNLIVRIEQNAKVHRLSYFVKSMPRSDEETRRMMEEQGMFAKEAKIYGELFSKWQQNGPEFDENFKWRPDCYLSRDDLIVLEDLRDTHCHFKGALKELDRPHCNEMLKAVARMHASSLNFEKNSLTGEKLNEGSFGHLFFEGPLKEGNPWFAAGLRLIQFLGHRFRDEFPGVEIPESEEEFMNRLNEVFKFRDEKNDFEKVLCHKDIWYTNLFYKYPAEEEATTTPEHCVIVDYQICHYQSPVLDVLIALFVTTRRQFRETELEDCFQFYRDYLTNVLQKQFKFTAEDIEALKFLQKEHFNEIRKYFQLYAHVINCVFIPLTHLPSGHLARIRRASPQKYYEICNVDRRQFAVERMEKDPYYKNYLLEVIGEIVEFLFKK